MIATKTIVKKVETNKSWSPLENRAISAFPLKKKLYDIIYIYIIKKMQKIIFFNC